jgi:hypothetical protein
MGRPIKNQYLNPDKEDGVGARRPGQGGEKVYRVDISDGGTGYYTANATVSFTAPQLVGGTTATGTVTLDGSGNVTAVVLTNVGSGYTSAPTVAFLGANSAAASGTAVLTTANVANALAANAWLTGGTVGVTNVDILKQRGSRTFMVNDGTRTGLAKLVTTDTPEAAGQMVLTATFANAATFAVAKITNRVVYNSAGTKFLWTLGAASSSTEPKTVTITNS